VLGAGVSGATAARELAAKGAEVTVFECGRGVGGRASTRRTRDGFSFDHGAQYISAAKSNEFATALQDWLAAGCVQDWSGRFASVSAAGELIAEAQRAHYVGVPSMNAISKHQLDHSNIETVLQTRAVARRDGATGQWLLSAHEDGRALGTFDYLVGSDRLSATNDRADLRDAPVPGYKALAADVDSIPSLVLMVAFESVLEGMPADGISFNEGGFGSVAWAARDTSKPGRARDDGKECWVVMSSPEAARSIIASVEAAVAREKEEKEKKDGCAEVESFEDVRERVRRATHDTLLADFLAVVGKLSPSNTVVPAAAVSIGHRWGAAFPSPACPTNGAAEQAQEWYSDLGENRFAACGDYFIGNYPGRVEGAYLSGLAAAAAVWKYHVQSTATSA
jgi:predicted NAD/FAD-dependent oxidoreductase